MNDPERLLTSIKAALGYSSSQTSVDMWEWQILSLVGFILLGLFLFAVGYILYSGLTSEIIIKTGLPPVRSITVAYKYRTGAYKDCGSVFKESSSIGPKLSCIGIFYDDPKKVPAQKCRYAVGSILSEGEDRLNEEQQKLYENHGFRVFSFPEVTHVVTTSFPHRTPLSIFLGVQRVYPQLNYYIKERKLCAHPFLEIYRGGTIHYMSPLARQGDFYVPEVREAQRWLPGKSPEEDERTDITGADSNSERSSSVSQQDASPAPSSTRTHSHPDRQQYWDFDRVERSDTSSVSSFEELELDSDRCEHTLPVLATGGKHNLQDQDREIMVEEE